MSEKLAVLLSGGGMKCTWGAGVMLALAEKLGVKEPPIVIAGSGSSGTGAYFVSKQYEAIRNIWGNLIPQKGVIDPFRLGKMMDIDFLIDNILKEKEPLKLEVLRSSPTHLLIPATNSRTGKLAYFSNKDNVDLYDAMRATITIPLAFNLNPHIPVNGSTYCDGPLSSNAENHIEKAVELGAKKILLVTTAPQDEGLKGISHSLFELWNLFKNPNHGSDYRIAAQKAVDYKPPKDVCVMSFVPESPLEINMLTRDSAALNRTIQKGYNEACSRTELARFLRK